jgi:hypothetical protein
MSIRRAPHHGARPVGEGTRLRTGVRGREAPGPEVFAILLTPGQEQLTPVLQAIFEIRHPEGETHHDYRDALGSIPALGLGGQL